MNRFIVWVNLTTTFASILIILTAMVILQICWSRERIIVIGNYRIFISVISYCFILRVLGRAEIKLLYRKSYKIPLWGRPRRVHSCYASVCRSTPNFKVSLGHRYTKRKNKFKSTGRNIRRNGNYLKMLSYRGGKLNSVFISFGNEIVKPKQTL